jgi:UDP-N-acetyl-D-galactosamine dehydrogenase
VTAGTYPAESIVVAEAAKVIENTQRDLNIALINEVAVICNKLGIDTEAVLKAAETKWNFQSFRPGLVGGHCIGVDPYYLTYKAQQVGYEPEVMLAGRKINDGMGRYVAGCLLEKMQKENIKIEKSKVLILGITFKENCGDCRNSKVFDVIDSLRKRDCLIDVCDPWVREGAVSLSDGVFHIKKPHESGYDAIVLAVSHREFKDWGAKKIRSFGRQKSVVYDLKQLLGPNESDIRL